METIITIKWPLKRVKNPNGQLPFNIPFRLRWHDFIWRWGGSSHQEFGGNRINTRRHLTIFGWHFLTIDRNEYHDKTDKERSDEYLNRWSECENELRGLRLIMMGDSTCSEVKKVIRDSLGVDLDEGISR